MQWICDFSKQSQMIFAVMLRIHLYKNNLNKIIQYTYDWASQVTQWAKNPPFNAGDGDSIPELGRSLGRGHGNPLQYSCLEYPMARGAWQVIVHRAAKSRMLLKWLSMHACMISSVPTSRLVLYLHCAILVLQLPCKVNMCKCSVLSLCNPWTVADQAPLSTEFSR